MQPIHILSPLVFLAAAVLVWAIGRKWAGRPKWLDGWTRAAKRRETRDAGPAAGVGSRLASLLHSPPLVPLIRPKTELDQRRLQLELGRAGFNGRRAVATYLLIRLTLPIVVAVVAAGSGMAITGLPYASLLIGFIAGMAGFLIPGVFLGLRQRRRQWEIRDSLPEVLDMLSVVIECGHGVDVALKNAVQDLRHSAPVLAGEFALYFQQLDLGRDRFEAIHDLAMRCGVPEMNAFASALVQAYRFGSSIVPALRHQSQHLRVMRKYQLEEAAHRAVFMLMFPLVLFIFPGIFVALVGPAAIMIMRAMAALR